mmetsp:Transcript_7483/g.20511  ORF Transcript_7483/g.20511 Transcript_7483/m.20511 type:complete len:210 (+) Transcript_7483:215-844(+)
MRWWPSPGRSLFGRFRSGYDVLQTSPREMTVTERSAQQPVLFNPLKTGRTLCTLRTGMCLAVVSARQGVSAECSDLSKVGRRRHRAVHLRCHLDLFHSLILTGSRFFSRRCQIRRCEAKYRKVSCRDDAIQSPPMRVGVPRRGLVSMRLPSTRRRQVLPAPWTSLSSMGSQLAHSPLMLTRSRGCMQRGRCSEWSVALSQSGIGFCAPR